MGVRMLVNAVLGQEVYLVRRTYTGEPEKVERVTYLHGDGRKAAVADALYRKSEGHLLLGVSWVVDRADCFATRDEAEAVCRGDKK
jgi:hypothetical protein